jgi:hypothetical protein
MLEKELETSRLAKIFNILRSQLKTKGYMNEVFTFIDASHLISKSTLWKERDKAIKKKYDKLNNESVVACQLKPISQFLAIKN